MVRKVIALMMCVALICAVGTTAHAQSYTSYNGSMSGTYVTYFRDIVSGIGFDDNYVAFRSGQYEYVMAVGDIEYANNNFTGNDIVTIYTFDTDSGYNASYTYNVSEDSSFSLSAGDSIVYSDLGQYPQLVERGAKYEIFTAVLVCVALLGIVVGRFFRKR